MNNLFLFAGTLLLLVLPRNLYAEEPGSQVVVIYNTRVSESKDVAEHYAARRHVPSLQVFGFDLPTFESMSRKDYHDRLEMPLLKALKSKHLLTFGPKDFPATTNDKPRHVENAVVAAKVRYAVLCYGVPLKISPDSGLREEIPSDMQKEMRRNEAAVDSELACLPLVEQNYIRAGLVTSPFYGCTNASFLSPTNGILLVTRLDGPSAGIARALVDKALEAETNGLCGRAYFDLRGLTTGNYKLGDDWIRGASEITRQLGFETIVDENGGTFAPSFPLSQIALYAGWYDENVSGPFTRANVEFMPGTFAYHLHSFSAATLRTTTRQWVGPLLAKGVTATMGCVDEPYLALTPNMAIFFSRFLASGFTFGEAAYACQNALSWQTTVVGDPLYAPFAKNPQEQLEDLARRQNPLVEWFILRSTNQRLLNQVPLATVTSSLEALPLTHQSPVLTEKLGELYSEQGKPASSVHALQQVLLLNPTPQQRTRVMLTLATRLKSLQRDGEAYGVEQQFVKEFPDYPDLLTIYRDLLKEAQTLGKKEDATAYEKEIMRLSPGAQLPKTPPVRKGV